MPTKKTMITQGSVKISFDCLLPNFFPKLMIRLRHLSSPLPAHLSRNHFVVHLTELGGEEKVARSSWVCVVQDPQSRSLLLYPGGCSFSATSICNTVIRELLKKSFSGMTVTEITFSADDELFSKKKILSRFGHSNSPTLTLDSGAVILLTFLSPLLGELDGNTANHNSTVTAASSEQDEDGMSHDLTSTLHRELMKYEESPDGNMLDLGHALIQTIPHFRHHGLELPDTPSILWLVGQSSDSSSSSSQFYLFAVSPSVKPNLSWEIVLPSVIRLPISPNFSSSHHATSVHDSASSRLLMRCLNYFLPPFSWHQHISEWSLSFPEGMMSGKQREAILKDVKQKEKDLFRAHLGMFGVEVLCWDELLVRQQGQEELHQFREMVVNNFKEIKLNQRTMMSQLDRVEGSLSQLTQQLSGVLVDIREELLLQAKTGSNEALAEIKEMWGTRMDNLERVIESSSENTEAMIKREMKGLEVKLVSKVHQLEMSVDPERMQMELSKVCQELIAANRGRMEGDEASAQKLDQILSEMRDLQSQLDRVEEKMTQFFGSLTQSLNSVQHELQAKGNTEGLNELRELWVGRMDELEDLIRCQRQSSNGNGNPVTNAATAPVVLSDAAIEKVMKKMDAMLSEKLFDFELSIDSLTPQLTEMKQQLLGVAAGVREGNELSQKRMDSMMLELKGLQTQFVEVIRLQNELSLNLNEVCALLLFSPHLCSPHSPLLSVGPHFFEKLYRQCEHAHLPHHLRFDSHSASELRDLSEGNGESPVRTLQSHPRSSRDCRVAAPRQVSHRSHLRGLSLSFRR
jgi:hypothetical protein